MKERPMDLLFKALRKRIISGDFSPSESLIESTIAKEYGVSRNTVKKAILTLEQEGLVTVEANKSAKVRSFSKNEVIDLLVFRQMTEALVTRLAVPFFKGEDIDEMQQYLYEMSEAKKKGNLMSYSKSHHRFHDKICELCPNKIAVETTKNLKLQLQKYTSIVIPGRPEHSLFEHEMILEGIKTKNPEVAENCMKIHIGNVERRVSELYDIKFLKD